MEEKEEAWHCTKGSNLLVDYTFATSLASCYELIGAGARPRELRLKYIQAVSLVNETLELRYGALRSLASDIRSFTAVDDRHTELHDR